MKNLSNRLSDKYQPILKKISVDQENFKCEIFNFSILKTNSAVKPLAYYFNNIEKPNYEINFLNLLKIKKSKKEKKAVELELSKKLIKLIYKYLNIIVNEKGVIKSDTQTRVMENETIKEEKLETRVCYHLKNWFSAQLYRKNELCKIEAYEPSIIIFQDGTIHLSKNSVYTLINKLGVKLYPKSSYIEKIESDNFSNGHIINKSAKIFYRNGAVYSGFMLFNKRHGKGEIIFSNGESYNGLWENGMKSGYGEYKWPNGDCYTGSWKFNCMNGEGNFYFSNGSVFMGEMKRNQFFNGEVYDVLGEKICFVEGEQKIDI